MSWKEKANNLHPIQRTLTRLQLSLKPRLCHARIVPPEDQDDELKGDEKICGNRSLSY